MIRGSNFNQLPVYKTPGMLGDVGNDEDSVSS